jgi:predicted dehydrogenase
MPVGGCTQGELTMSKINVVVIGLGWVATQRHIPIILRQPRLHLYGVVDKRAERLQNLSAKYPWIKTSISQDAEMPWGDDVQAVLIATDPLNHYRLAKQVLLAGKHLLMEKPLTMSPDEGRKLVELAEKQKLSFCVVHNFQFARSTLRLKQMIAEGKLGEIQSIEAAQFSNPRRRLPVWYEQLPFGLFYDESPHMFYMLETLAGRSLTHLHSTVIQHPAKNTPIQVSAHYMAGSVPIRLMMNFEAALSEWHIFVQGTRAVGIVDIFRDILVTLPNDGSHRAREILTSSVSAIATHARGFLASGLLLAQGRLFYGADIVWKKFIHDIDGNGLAEEISARRGLHIVEMQHEIMTKSELVDFAVS